MHITFSPLRHDAPLALHRSGDVLTINGEAFDFSALPEGGLLPRDAIACDWIAADVERRDGVLHIGLLLPHGPDAPVERLWPVPVTLTRDGTVPLPGETAQAAADSLAEAAA